MSDLTLIIPAKNEKESLPKVLDELNEFNFRKNLRIFFIPLAKLAAGSL